MSNYRVPAGSMVNLYPLVMPLKRHGVHEKFAGKGENAVNATTDSLVSGLNDEENIEAEWQSENRTRAALYNLFATAMARQVDEAWLNPGFTATLRGGLPDNPGKELVLKAIDSAQTDRKYFDEMQLDFDALFTVPGSKLIFPYESCYMCRNVDGTFGRLWQEPAQDMYRILQEWQLKFAEGWDLIPDHIAVELFFMAHVCHVAGEADFNDQEVVAKLKDWQERFFRSHLAQWVFYLLRNMEQKAGTDYYRGLTMLLRAFLAEEWKVLKSPEDDLHILI